MSDVPTAGDEGEPRVVVRDKRRIDPESGNVREPFVAEVAGTEGVDAGSAATPPGGAEAAKVAELTDTLQRLKAEYDNYRRRAERERTALVELSTGSVLAAFLPVLDDIERARAHGDLVGAFGTVGESFVATTAKLGLEPYAAPGDEFDPQIHEAVMQAAPAEDSDVPVVAQVFRPGYRHGGRVLRAAQVSVSEPGRAPSSPESPTPATELGEESDSDEETTPST